MPFHRRLCPPMLFLLLLFRCRCSCLSSKSTEGNSASVVSCLRSCNPLLQSHVIQLFQISVPAAFYIPCAGNKLCQALFYKIRNCSQLILYLFSFLNRILQGRKHFFRMFIIIKFITFCIQLCRIIRVKRPAG